MSFINKMRRQSLASTILVLGTLTVGILIGTVLSSNWGHASAQSGASDATPLTVPPIKNIGNEFSALAEKLEQSVVAIRVDVPATERAGLIGRGDGQDGDLQDLFRRFMPGPNEENDENGEAERPEGPAMRTAFGTGFIVDKNGYIMTNYHVVESAAKITVSLLHDSSEYRAQVVGADFESDLAVIKIESRKPLKAVTIANSDSVQVGDWAIAIGSPFGLASSVTAGIVSAIGRGPDQLVGEAKPFQNFIQTDAAINPGNSGGPLLNIRGEVIGINTMIETRSGGSDGIGFAVPMNMGVRVYNDIIREGRVTRGSIGVTLSKSNRPETVLKAFGLDHGALIEAVKADGPAANAGMKAGDIVLAINDKQVKNNQDLVALVADLPVGKTAAMLVDRDGKTLDLKVSVLNRSDYYKDNSEIVGTSKMPSYERQTSSVSDIKFGFTPRVAVAHEKDLASGHGMVVVSLQPDSFAADLGLREGDIIESINRRPVSSIDEINQIRGALKPGDPVAFHVYRQPTRMVRSNGRERGTRATGPADSLYLAGTIPER